MDPSERPEDEAGAHERPRDGESHSPALRLLSPDGRLLRGRPIAVPAALLIRLGLLRGYAIWPDARWPIQAVDVGAGGPAEWLDSSLGTDRGSATAAALRCRAVLVGGPPRVLLEAAETGLRRPLRAPRIALYSPSGLRISKVICFAFEGTDREPTVAIQAMADPRLADRLQQESATVERVRADLAHAPAIREGMPLKPLHAGWVRGEYVVALPIDPLAGATGRECREEAIAWLRGLHEATATTAAWTATDGQRELEALEQAWSLLRPKATPELIRAVRPMLRGLRDAQFPAGVIHGDYWRGNIAVGDSGQIRVYDWEWTEPSGHPALDLLVFEIGEIRLEMDDAGDRNLVGRLHAGVERVRDELRLRALDESAALALLAPVMGRFVKRSHQMVTGPDDPLLRLMEATEALTAVPVR